MKTATKSNTYYNVCVLEATDDDTIGSWAIHFGDYDRDVAEDEAEDVLSSYGVKKSKIVASTLGRNVNGSAHHEAQVWCDAQNAKLEPKRQAAEVKRQAAEARAMAKVAAKAEAKHQAALRRIEAKAAKAETTAAIIYEGPSLIDGSPIVVVATVGSKNSKTGDMVQTWILRADVAPIEANRTGLDIAICGNCPHRGLVTEGAKMAQNRTCYVNIGQAPTAVYKAFKRGSYRYATTPAARAAIGRGRMVRVGAYGDGAAAPVEVWNELKAEAEGHTAYSHQVAVEGAAFDPSIYMQSVESVAEASTAWAAGRRTFRIVADVAEIVKGAEVECPSERGVKCADCGLCDGSKRAKSVAIVVHGTGAKHFAAAVQ